MKLAPAMVGSLLGLWAGYRLKSHEFRATEITARVDDMIGEIGTIENISVEYWSRACGTEESRTEALLVGRVHRLNEFIAFCAIDSYSFKNADVKHGFLEFKKAVTGGRFQEVGRPADPQRIRAVVRAATQLLIALRRARRSLL